MRRSRLALRFLVVLCLLRCIPLLALDPAQQRCVAPIFPWTLLDHPSPDALPADREICRVTAYNLENFLMHVGRWEGTGEGRRQTVPERPKDPEAIKGVGRMLRALNGDLDIGEEIEGGIPTMVEANKL